VVTLAVMLLAFPAGVYTYYFTRLSANFSAASPVAGVYLFVGPSVVLLPVQTTLGAIFMFLTVVYALMFVLAAYQGRGIITSLKSAFKEGFGAFFSNTLLASTVAISFLIFTVVEFDQFETSSGVPIGNISGDALQLFTQLALAPLREELGFRMVIIGLLAVVACVGLPWRTVLKALWRPSVAYEGREGDRVTTYILLVGMSVSAITFGLAHILSNSGWEIGKLPVAVYAGYVLGYLYYKYGFHVAVLAHWGTDYLSTAFAYMGQGAPSGSLASNVGNWLDNFLSIDMVYLMGFASFLIVLYLGYQRMQKWRAARRAYLPSSEIAPAA